MMRLPWMPVMNELPKSIGIRSACWWSTTVRVRLGRFWEAYRKKGNHNLLDAVYAAEFGSYAQFYRVYREAYGEGPRKSLRAPHRS